MVRSSSILARVRRSSSIMLPDWSTTKTKNWPRARSPKNEVCRQLGISLQSVGSRLYRSCVVPLKPPGGIKNGLRVRLASAAALDITWGGGRESLDRVEGAALTLALLP